MQFHWQHEFLFHPTHPGISLHGSAGNTLLYPTDRTSGASQGCSQNFLGDSSLGAMESTNLPLSSSGILNPCVFLWKNVLCWANRQTKKPMHALFVSAPPAQCLGVLLRVRLGSGCQFVNSRGTFSWRERQLLKGFREH